MPTHQCHLLLEFQGPLPEQRRLLLRSIWTLHVRLIERGRLHLDFLPRELISKTMLEVVPCSLVETIHCCDHHEILFIYLLLFVGEREEMHHASETLFIIREFSRVRGIQCTHLSLWGYTKVN